MFASIRRPKSKTSAKKVSHKCGCAASVDTIFAYRSDYKGIAKVTCKSCAKKPSDKKALHKKRMSLVMVESWKLAKAAQLRHGGRAREYLSECMKMAHKTVKI